MSASEQNPKYRISILAAAMLALMAPSALSAEEKKEGWSDTAELSVVTTNGNSETQTFGFKNKLWREWAQALFELNAGGVQSNTTTVTKTARGTPDDFSVREESDTETNAERYYVDGRYNREISERFFWFGAGGWERNRDAGVENRYTAGGGVGNQWVNREDLKFRTDYAVTYTDQEDVVDDPDTNDTYLSLRVSSAYLNQFGKSTTYTNDLVLNENLDDSEDFRADMTNAVSVKMNAHLALKVSHQLLFDNQPSLEEVPLFDTAGNDTGETVLVELDEIDTVFTASLVVNF